MIHTARNLFLPDFCSVDRTKIFLMGELLYPPPQQPSSYNAVPEMMQHGETIENADQLLELAATLYILCINPLLYCLPPI